VCDPLADAGEQYLGLFGPFSERHRNILIDMPQPKW
jgi:hypothetical protein